MNASSVTQDWSALANAVIERRTQLGLTQQDVQAAGGPATATLRNIEGAHNTTYRKVILSRLEKALGWKSGSVRAILAGGEATVDQQSPTPPSEQTARVRQGLPATKTLGDLLVERGLRQPDELVVSDEYQVATDKFITELVDADEFDEEFKDRWLSSYSNMRREIFDEMRRQKGSREG